MKLRKAVWKIFSIHKDEVGFVIPLFFLYLLSGSFYAIGQIFSETIFLKAYGAKGLSRFFVYNGIALIVVGILYNSILTRISLRKGYIILISLFSILLFSSTVLLLKGYAWLPFYLYLANYLFTFFLDIHFFNYAYQFLSLRSSKRILPFVMGGGKLGGIIASLLIFTIFSKDISGFGIYIWAINGILLLLPVILLGFIAGARERKTSVKAYDLKADFKFFEGLLKKIKLSYSSEIFAYSVLAIFIMSVANHVSEYFFMKIFNQAFETKKQLVSFLSIYTFIADFITLIIQIFIASRIIKWLGVKKSNYVYPSAFLTLIVFCIFFPGLMLGILLRFFRKNLSFIIRVPVYNIIMASAPKDRMAEVKSFISGIISPLGMIAGGGVILLLYKKLSIVEGFAIAVAVGLVFIAFTFLQNRAYMGSLKSSILFDSDNAGGHKIDYQDYGELLSSSELIEENMKVIELFFNEHPSVEVARVVYPYFDRLSYTSKENILHLLHTSRFDNWKKILYLSIRDSEPYIRSKGLSMLREIPLKERNDLLENYPRNILESEKYALTVLRADFNEDESAEIDIDYFVTDTILRLKRGILDRKISPLEFIVFMQVLPYQYFLEHLVELAVSMHDVQLFRSIIPFADKLSIARARELIDQFMDVNLDYLANFIELSGKLDESDKIVLLDKRYNIPAEYMDRLFYYNAEAGNYVIKGLFEDRSHQQKANYLNYLLSLNVRSGKMIDEFIDFELIRIVEIMEVRNSIEAIAESDKSEYGNILKFLGIAFQNELEIHKHLILKAIAVLSGMQIDEAYESNLLLKDKDLNNYILEYIEASSSQTKQVLFIFEDEMLTREVITLGDGELEIKLSESLVKISGFFPELSSIFNFCMSSIYGDGSDIRIFSAEKIEKNIKTDFTREELWMLSLIEKILFLKNSRLFNNMEIVDLVHIAMITREIEVPQNRIIIEEGDTGDELFIIVDGEVEVYTGDRVLAKLGKEDCIGELAIIDKEPRSASVKTLKNTRILSISRKDFLMTLKENPAISINVIQVIADRLRVLIS